MPLLPVLIIAAIQGVTELFPISSLGHAVVLPAILRLPIDQADPAFLPVLVVLHLGTALALIVYFWRDWVAMTRGLIALDASRRRGNLKLLELMVIATIPAIVLGFLFEKRLRLLFATPTIAAAFLIANGVLLLVGERMRRRRDGKGSSDPTSLGRTGAFMVGIWQCLAFLPGISRSGATLVGGLRAGLDHRASAHFSFLIATPVILGATVLEVPKLLHHGMAPGIAWTALLGGVVAGIAAYASTAFLMRYFRRREIQALDPFAWYCIVGGIVALVFIKWA